MWSTSEISHLSLLPWNLESVIFMLVKSMSRWFCNRACFNRYDCLFFPEWSATRSVILQPDSPKYSSVQDISENFVYWTRSCLCFWFILSLIWNLIFAFWPVWVMCVFTLLGSTFLTALFRFLTIVVPLGPVKSNSNEWTFCS